MKARGLGLLVLGLVLTFACGAGSTPAPVTGGKLVWGKEQEATSTNPFKTGDSRSAELFRMVYQTPTQPTKEGGVTGELATSWDMPSPTSFVFHLRPGVKFSNGREMDASDFVTTWDQFKAAGVFTTNFGPLKTATAVDPLTVRFDLTAPYLAFPKSLYRFYVLPGKEILAGTLNPDKDLLGTGPFMVKDHLQGVSWTFVKNPNYWRKGYPLVDQVEMKVIADEASRLAALKSGSIDFATYANNDTAKLLQGAPNTKVVAQDQTDFYALLLNAVNPKSPFVDLRVRQAINLALNRQQIIQVGLAGIGTATGEPPVSQPGGCNLKGMPFASQDIAKAKALLKEVGVTSLSINMHVSTQYSGRAALQVAQVIQSELAQIGVQTNISDVDVGTFVKDLLPASGQVDIEAAELYFSGGADPGYTFRYFLPKLQRAWIAPDPDLQSATDSALATADGPARDQLLQQVCARVLIDSNMIPIATRALLIGYRTDRVKPVLLPFETNWQSFRKLDEFTRVAP